MAAHLGALADASAALAAQGVDGPSSDVADVVLLPSDTPPPPFFRAHAALLAARSPYLAAALRFNGAGGVAAGEGRGLRQPPPPRRPLPRVRVGVATRPLAALLRFVYTGSMSLDALVAAEEEDGGPEAAAVTVHPPTIDALLSAADVTLVPGAKRAIGNAVDAVWTACERGGGGSPPPLRSVCEVLFSADARRAATLRRAALVRVAAAFDAAADAVVAAAQAGTDPPPDAAALAALVAAASAADADAAAAASARSRGVITATGGPGGLGVQSLCEDVREAYLEAAGRGQGRGGRVLRRAVGGGRGRGGRRVPPGWVKREVCVCLRSLPASFCRFRSKEEWKSLSCWYKTVWRCGMVFSLSLDGVSSPPGGHRSESGGSIKQKKWGGELIKPDEEWCCFD